MLRTISLLVGRAGLSRLVKLWLGFRSISMTRRTVFYLPASRVAQAASGGAYHRALHTNRYYRAVNELLENAATREEALEVLHMVGSQLQQNTFLR